jgi:ubiquinone/menaquinone biosynthesis C-methylase UbiE
MGETTPRESYTHASDETTTQHLASRTAARQAAFFLPYLQSGMRLLDCGCGPGSITLGLAKFVAPGEVVGIDIGEAPIGAARLTAAQDGIANARFEVASVYEIPYPDGSFDAVYSNALLSHLGDPVAALREMARVLKPGGVAGIRNPDVDGQIIAPNIPALHRGPAIYAETVAANGGNARIGKHHKTLLRQAGFVVLETSAAYEVYASRESVQHWGGLWVQGFSDEAFTAKLVADGTATAEEINTIRQAWQAWREHPDAFFADAWFEAVGRKPTDDRSG